MSCERYSAAIVDHACGADLPVEARAHLAGCARCEALFDEQRRLIAGLDAELSAVIAIDPSPQFAPRVRAAVEATAVASHRHRWLWLGGFAATAAAALIVASLPAEHAMAPPAPPVAFGAMQQSETGIVESALDRAPRPPTPLRRTAASELNTASAHTPPEPEVIVSPAQRAAVDRYVAMFRAGSLETSALATSPQPLLAPPSDLVVAPLEVEPMAVPGGDVSTTGAVERRHD
jgi:hypothetical protein